MLVSLYHQLVAGPIVRYSHIAEEIDNRKEKLADISKGISRFCIGLFKKVVIANVAAELVAKYMDADASSQRLLPLDITCGTEFHHPIVINTAMIPRYIAVV